MRRIVPLIVAAVLMGAGTAQATERSSTTEPATASAVSTVSPKLDINRATREDLLSVPGIGPRMAQAIIDLRTRKGSFTKIEELLDVRGIKQKKLAKLSALLTVVPRQPSTAAVPTSTAH